MRARRAGAPAAAVLGGERSGRVASIHERVIVLLLDDGPLVALLPGGAPLHPWAVELDGPVPGGVGEGDAVRVTGTTLAIGPQRVALDGMAVAELRLAARTAAPDPAAVRALARRVPARDAGGPFEPVLAAALASYRDCGDPAVLAVLVGIGEGLTPSGDDVIVGALAALDALGDAMASRRLGQALAGCAVRTTRLAAQSIEAALDGRHAEPVLGVLEALAGAPGYPRSAWVRSVGPPPARLAAAAAALLAVGHRSGADTLRGIVAVLEGYGAIRSSSTG
jgi:hypothetical protein